MPNLILLTLEIHNIPVLLSRFVPRCLLKTLFLLISFICWFLDHKYRRLVGQESDTLSKHEHQDPAPMKVDDLFSTSLAWHGWLTKVTLRQSKQEINRHAWKWTTRREIHQSPKLSFLCQWGFVRKLYHCIALWLGISLSNDFSFPYCAKWFYLFQKAS